ncbi:M56 family metallopeptidase [Pedobacter sp.]|uniref:M56 family metallopeptidase n=1 Tax=Pedobacter sp. TaxID=1411316 RepID=UPI0031D747B1
MEAIINNLIKAIGWSILHSLWQGAIVFAILFIALSVRPKMSARLKHNLAMGALFLIFISFCLTFASLFNLPSKTAAVGNTELNETTLQQLYNLTHSWSFKTESYFPYIVSLYVLGISFQLIVLISGYLRLKQLKNNNISNFPLEWLTVAQTMLQKLNINKKVQFHLSEKVNIPLTIGFLKPVVLFPVALVAHLDIKQVEAILIHELSHIRRNDYVLNLIKTGIETLLFFNPFVWLSSRFIHIEREHACDDLVVKFTGAPVAYAHALLKLELIKDKTQPALSLAATGNNQHLYQRIKRITDMKTNYMNAKQKILALCLTLATMVSLAWINPAKKEDAPKKQKKFVSVSTLINTPPSQNELTCLKADTDTVKRKKGFKAIIKDKNGNNVVYHSLEEMPDSVRAKLADLDKYFNSKEWKDKMAKIEFNSKELEKKFESKEWKDKMAKIEFNSKELEKKFESKEWKDKMAKIEFDSKELDKVFNSKEWKDKIAKIDFDSKELEKIFNSKEWKDKMAKIEFNSVELSKKFESEEWKKHMEAIEKMGRDMSEKFNSPEWKKKMKEMDELKNSPEYKKLREKYEKDLEELKKKKGINTDKAFLIYDGSNPMQIASLPLTAIENIQKVLISPKNLIKIEKTAEPIAPKSANETAVN